MATDTYGFGTDISCFPDLDPSFAEVAGAQVIAESTIRRWQTIRGECSDDPDAGEDLRIWLNRKWTRKNGYDLKIALEREAEKDERVMSCLVALELVGNSSISISASFVTVNGIFELSTTIDNVTAKFLGIEVTT